MCLIIFAILNIENNSTSYGNIAVIVLNVIQRTVQFLVKRLKLINRRKKCALLMTQHQTEKKRGKVNVHHNTLYKIMVSLNAG